MKLSEAFAKRRTYGSTTTGIIPRHQHERIAKRIVDHAEKFAEEENYAGEDNLVVWEAFNQTNYEYRILMGFVERELRRRGSDANAIKRQLHDFADMQDDANQGDKDHNWGHNPVMQEAFSKPTYRNRRLDKVYQDLLAADEEWMADDGEGDLSLDQLDSHAFRDVVSNYDTSITDEEASDLWNRMHGRWKMQQEAYDTVPIHPYWGGPATPDNTQIHPYYSTDFYQALSGGGDMSGGASIGGVEGEEDTMDEFSLGDDEQSSDKESFTDFLGGCCCDGGGEQKDVHELKGGWKLYRIDDEESVTESDSRDCPDCEGGWYTDPKNVDARGNCKTCGGSGEVGNIEYGKMNGRK